MSAILADVRKRIWVVLLVTVAWVASGCSIVGGPPEVRPAAETLTAAMTSGDFSEVVTGPEVDLQAEWDTIMAGMDGLTPNASIAGIELSEDDQLATVDLSVEWPFESDGWSYRTRATFRLVDRHWVLKWTPATVHPSLTGGTRFTHQYLSAERADIVGAGGEKIVTSREVLEVGIDKQQLDGADAVTSAKALATLMKVDPENYAAQVEASGPEAFVIAIVVRGGSPAVLPEGISDIPGARAIQSTRILAPSREFAQAILGTVAPADEEAVKASGGRISPGDWVGASGLQARYDEQLRGLPGDRVVMVDRKPTNEDGTEPAPAPESETFEELFRTEPARGEALRITLDLTLQEQAEQALADVGPAASLVVVDRETGAILAAANGPGDGANPNATVGRYAPGSTFKPVTALALLRKGFTADSAVECSSSFTVDGRRFTNYSDFPSGQTGRTTMAGAMASSCNTAFIAQHERVTGDDITAAAASLGLGEDHDAGFPIFYGSVPEPANVVGKAESMIGQGLVESSPTAMAGVVASIASGGTVLPYLVEGQQPKPTAQPLTTEEAGALRGMLEGVVDHGTGGSLAGVLDGAKTGTAEYGTDDPPKTHAWMVGWNADVAVVAFVADGDSGSGTAGPLIKELLG